MNSINRILLFFGLLVLSQLSLAQPEKNLQDEKKRLEFDKHFFEGMKEKMIQNYEAAESNFKAAILIESKNANVHYQLANILVVQKRYSEAIMHAERAFHLESNNSWYSKFLIELYKRDGQLSEAIKVCELAYAQTNDLHFLYELASFYDAKNEAKKAIKVLNTIEKEKGIQEDIIRKKEDIFLKQKNVKAAIKEIEKLCNAFPDRMNYMGMLADLYMNANRQKDALNIYDKIQKTDPRNGYAALSLADYYQSKKDLEAYYSQLMVAMKSSLETNVKMQVMAMLIPGDVLGIDHRARCKALIDTFIVYHPTAAEPYLLKGDMAMQARNLEEARLQYLKSIDLNNSSILPWEQVLFCDQQLPNYQYLLQDCEKMMVVFPQNGNVFLLHSIAARQLKMFDTAFESARKAVWLANDEDNLLQSLGNLGDMAHYAKKYEVSDSAFEAILAIEPNSALSLNNYAYFLSLRNTQLDKAMNMSKRSLALDPNNPSNLDTYAWILYQLNNLEEARKYAEKSLEISPDNAEVLDHLGDILFGLGEKESALKNWQKAQALGMDSSVLLEKIKTKSLIKQ